MRIKFSDNLNDLARLQLNQCVLAGEPPLSRRNATTRATWAGNRSFTIRPKSRGARAGTAALHRGETMVGPSLSVRLSGF
jgi:hypothetical protein